MSFAVMVRLNTEHQVHSMWFTCMKYADILLLFWSCSCRGHYLTLMLLVPASRPAGFRVWSPFISLFWWKPGFTTDMRMKNDETLIVSSEFVRCQAGVEEEGSVAALAGETSQPITAGEQRAAARHCQRWDVTHTHTHSLTHSLSHTHTHTHTHTLSHTHTHTHTHTLSHTYTHTHTHTHTHTRSHIHTHTHTHTHALTHTYTHTHALTHTLTLTLSHTLSLTHSHTHTHTHTHTLSHTLTHTHTLTHICTFMVLLIVTWHAGNQLKYLVFSKFCIFFFF